MSPRRWQRGLTVVELLVVVIIVGILAGIGASLIPRHGFAVAQGQRIFASAVQFARFEAIKRNTSVEISFDVGSSVLTVHADGDPGTEFRRFRLDPHGDRVVIKAAAPESALAFNALGVATSPISRSVTIGIDGLASHYRVLAVSGQGAVRVQS